MNKPIVISTQKKIPKLEGKKSKVQVEVNQGEISITGIPEEDELDSLSKDGFSKEIFVIVYRETKTRNYRVHIGKEKAFIELEVTSFDRLRDGGTTYIYFSYKGKIGTIYFPSPMSKKNEHPYIKIPEFGSFLLERINFG